MWSPDLAIEVLVEFVEAQYKGRRRRKTGMEMLWQCNSMRRSRYAMEKYRMSLWYEVNLARKRELARLRREDVELRIRNGILHQHEHHQRRLEMVSGRKCIECGREVQLRGGMGRVPRYCSRSCSARRASRDWWRRHRGVN
jgi:hypothetical protein